MQADRIDELQAEFTATKAEISAKLEYAQTLLVQAADELRRLKAETTGITSFTEKQFAAQLQIGESTLARLRIQLALPHFRAGDCVRYTPDDERNSIAIMAHRPAKSRRLRLA